MKKFAMLAALICVLGVQAKVKKPVEKDEDKFKGTWQMVSGDKGGEKPPEEFVKSFRLTFKGEGKLTAFIKGKDENGTYKIDAGKKPKQIEVSIEDKTMEGIYELNGDNLTLCIGEGARPTEFKSPEGSKIMLMMLKREKK